MELVRLFYFPVKLTIPWEQLRERPSGQEEQKKYYSGKKKNHTLKTTIIVLPSGIDK